MNRRPESPPGIGISQSNPRQRRRNRGRGNEFYGTNPTPPRPVGGGTMKAAKRSPAVGAAAGAEMKFTERTQT